MKPEEFAIIECKIEGDLSHIDVEKWQQLNNHSGKIFVFRNILNRST